MKLDIFVVAALGFCIEIFNQIAKDIEKKAQYCKRYYLAYLIAFVGLSIIGCSHIFREVYCFGYLNENVQDYLCSLSVAAFGASHINVAYFNKLIIKNHQARLPKKKSSMFIRKQNILKLSKYSEKLFQLSLIQYLTASIINQL